MRIYSPPHSGPSVDALVEAGRYAEAVEAVHASMPLSFLSPSAHRGYATALRGVGRFADADREDEMAELILGRCSVRETEPRAPVPDP
ncbi:hypothetical protein G7085_11885 [Tessaracoccus sp. HDW20]|uniref:hypothetical protein n=1 Tax=Tessaracoccus coleopterorum TaxID=2714950 RepID=UPI0018D2BCB6|nr:hypothetical protein [Tessaracoccus coleopterorum]NHB85077.1 hypothetical protein [Tessaracoccus coleopterorum]